MAVENLSIDVEINITKAIEALDQLQEELENVADKIADVDRRGSTGISIRTNVDEIDDDLALLTQKIQTWEAANSIDIDTNVGDMTVGGGGRTFADRPSTDLREAVSFGDDDGRMFGGLRRAFSGLSDRIDNVDLRMTDLHNMLARLVPLLLTFIGAIPAAITAIYGLAAAGVAAATALAAIGGFGALGVALVDGQFQMDRLSEIGNRLQNSFIEAFAPLAEQLEPLFIDAVDGLERLFMAIASQGDVLLEFTDDARAFGSFVLEFIPEALRAVGALADSFSNVFSNIGMFLQQNFTDGVRTLVQVTQDALPTIANMVILIGRAVPAIIEMSVGFARVVNIVIQTVGAISQLFGLIGIGPQRFGLLTAAILTSVSAMLLLRSSLIQFAVRAALSAISSVAQLITSYTALTASTTAATVATYALATAIVTLIGVVTLGVGIAVLGGIIGGIADQFGGLKSEINGTTEALREFDSLSSSVSGGTGRRNPYDFDPDDDDGGSLTTTDSGGTTINIESSGNEEEDRSNSRYAAWAQGRDTGGG